MGEMGRSERANEQRMVILEVSSLCFGEEFVNFIVSGMCSGGLPLGDFGRRIDVIWT
jgi:hypothetical protein